MPQSQANKIYLPLPPMLLLSVLPPTGLPGVGVGVGVLDFILMGHRWLQKA